MMSFLSQMHNVLEVVRKEQDIYNIVFHELIRQVRVSNIFVNKLVAIIP